MLRSYDEERDFAELENMLGDAMDIKGIDIDEDEVLGSRKFGVTEMEDVLGDTLDEMGYDDEW